MSKIICEVCGTSYPETASQCPICGCVRPVETQSVAAGKGDTESGSGYTYVKGGRFSKANVKKRNKANNSSPNTQPAPNGDDNENKSTVGLIITAIVLLLAIIAVATYIALNYFNIPINLPKDTEPSTGEVTQGQNITEPSTNPEIPCKSLMLDAYSFTLDNAGVARMLYVTANPADTTDEIVYRSSDEKVATVSASGKVTAVGPGQAVITATCGSASVECVVNCTFAEETEPSTVETTAPPVDEVFKLNRKDITFSKKGDSWNLYSGKIGLTLIQWSSDNEKIAAIENGKVTAVGSGTTTVYGEYNGEKVSCIIRCSFADDNQNPGVGGSGGITEDGGSTNNSSGGTYQMVNPYGNSEDVTIKVGEVFYLKVVDGSGNTAGNVTWTVADDSCCTVSGGTVTGVGSGTTTVTATCNGQTFTCTVRVQ